MRLTIELVPSTSWHNNLRKILSKKEWDILRKKVYEKANYFCEICSGKGEKWPVECHEIWRYDDENSVQYLDGMIALCPDCHQVKHIGLAQVQGHYNKALKHFAKVNNIKDLNLAEKYVEDAFFQHQQRSSQHWSVKSNIEGITI